MQTFSIPSAYRQQILASQVIVAPEYGPLTYEGLCVILRGLQRDPPPYRGIGLQQAYRVYGKRGQVVFRR